jgi:uncharacterized repeat protein (TIGR02543 family)
MKRVIRKFFFAAAIAIAAIANVEAQNSFAYQAVIRSAKGELVSNQEIGMQISLLYNDKVVYSETHTPKTNQYGNVQVEVGKGQKVSGDFAAVPWSTMKVMMKIEADPNGGTNYIDLGTIQLQPAPYAMYAPAAGAVSTIQAGDPKSDSDALFEVKDKDGNVVFAVYPDGVRVFVDDSDSTKAARTGFAVAGRRAAKEGEEANYFEVTTNGTQVFVDEDNAGQDSAKAMNTGFAVSGRRAAKDVNADLFTVGSTGTQVYIDEDVAKAARTGFAVAGRRAAKDGESDKYLEINPDGTRVYIDSEEDSTKAMRTGFAVSGRRAAKDDADSKLFEINADGTRVYVDDDQKAARTGFAVAGRRAAKGNEPKLFEVNSFGTQIYIETEGKPVSTGFAVSGRRAAKAGQNVKYMVIDADGTRIYVDYDEAKAMRTGFAVSGRRAAKDGEQNTILEVNNQEGTRAYVDDIDGKPVSTGFAVSGRRAAKEGEPDLMRITSLNSTITAANLAMQDKKTNNNMMSITPDNTKINTDELRLLSNDDSEVLSTTNGNVDVKNDLVVSGEVAQNVDATENEDVKPLMLSAVKVIETVKIADTIPGLDAPKGYAFLKIYGNGKFAQTKNIDSEKNAYMFFSAAGNLVANQSDAVAAVIMTKASTPDAQLIIWPLKQANTLRISFGLMAEGDTSNRYVPVEALINADGPVECLVDVKSANEELGKVRIEGPKVYGSKVEIHAEPIVEGYHFAGWSDERSANPRTVLILHDTAFASAKFEINTYNITTSAENGTVEIVGESNDDGTFNHGTKIELKAIASDNYHFANWTDGDTANPREFTIVSDTAFEAVFVQDEISKTVTVTFFTGDGSTVDPIDANYNTTIMEPGAPTLDNYQFGGWYTDEKFTNQFDFSAPVTDNITVYAQWILNSYSISIAPVEGGEAKVKTAANADDGKYSHGTRVTVTASASEGYEFVEWAARDMELDDAQKKDTVLEFEITSDVNLRPVFALKKYLINATAEEGGSISTEGLDLNNYAEHGTEVTLTAQPSGDAYEFAGWESDNLELTDEQKWSETIEIEVKQAFDITAKFALKKYLVQTGGGQNGKVTVTVKEGPEPENDYYVHGTVVKFTAEPNGPDYEFGEWLGSVINTLTDEQKHSNEIQVTVTSEIIAQATFKQKMAVTFNANGGKFGNDDAVTSTTIYVSNGGKIAQEQIPAPTREGYTLTNWLDADGNPFDFSTEINGNIELTAQWVREFYVASRSDGEVGSGTIDNPFASVQVAFDSILDEKKTNTDYRIVVLGTLEGGQSMGDFFEEDNGETATTLEGTTITLVGQEHNQQSAVIDATKDEENDPIALQVFTNIPVTIENLTITGGRNREAGGIQISSEDGVVSHVTLGAGALVTENYVLEGGGGGVSVHGEGSTFKMLPGSKITNNIAGTEDDATNSVNGQGANGGGVYVGVGSTFIMAGGVISGNEAVSPENDYQNYYGRGGGVYNEGVMYMYGSAVIGDTTPKTEATASQHSNIAMNGGGIFNNCGQLWIGYKPGESSDDAPVPDEEFIGGIAYNYAQEKDNTCGNGGGIGLGGYNDGESNHIYKCKIAYNAADLNGGGIGRIFNNSGHSALSIDQSIIKGNVAGIDGYEEGGLGGGLFLNMENAYINNTIISNNTATNDGGGLYFEGYKIALDNCQVTGNKAMEGAGVYLMGDGELHMNNGSITDNTLLPEQDPEDDSDDPQKQGVYINYSSEMYVSGAPVVDEVYGDYPTVVYIECEKKYTPNGHYTEIESDARYDLVPLALGTGADITVTPAEYTVPKVSEDGLCFDDILPIIGNCTAVNYEYFSVTGDDRAWFVNPDGYLIYECTVDFVGKGTNSISSQTVMYGEKIDDPTGDLSEAVLQQQQQLGYDFAGWSKEDGTVFDPENEFVTENMTLSPKWIRTINVNTSSVEEVSDGSENHPFKHIQDAVDAIAGFNHPEADYTIMVTGWDNENVTIEDSETEEFPAKSIMLKGAGNGDKGIKNDNNISTPLVVRTKRPVTLQDFKIYVTSDHYINIVDKAIALFVGKGADVTLGAGTEINGNGYSESVRGGVVVAGKLTMNGDANIHGFTTSGSSSNTIQFHNAPNNRTYQYCSAGGVFVDGGELVMNDNSSIYSCKATGSDYGGGAIHMLLGSVTMNGKSTIGGSAERACVAGYYGSICIEGGTFIMNDEATISYCKGGTNGGGAVYVKYVEVEIVKNHYYEYPSGKFIMNGGEISHNTNSEDGTDGHGLYLVEGSEFTMTGGTIKENTGDGVFIQSGQVTFADEFGINYGEFDMQGGTIGSNGGHGVYVGAYVSGTKRYAGVFKMGGSALIQSDDDVYLSYGSSGSYVSQAQVTIAEDLQNDVKITPENYSSRSAMVKLAQVYNEESSEWEEITSTSIPYNKYKFKVTPCSVSGDIETTYLIGDDGQLYIDINNVISEVSNLSEDGTVVLAGQIEEDNQSTWLGNLAETIRNKSRYITLDLSNVVGVSGTFGETAFKNCNNLAGIVLPEGITQIGSSAFRGTSIALIDIPDGVTTIGENAFNGCVNLESVVLPASLTSIGDNAFADCSNLKTVYYRGSESDKETFWNNSSDETIKNADWICNSVSLYVSPNGVDSYYAGQSAASPCKTFNGSDYNCIFHKIKNRFDGNIIVFVNGTQKGSFTLDAEGFNDEATSITFCGFHGLRNGAPMDSIVGNGTATNDDVFAIKTTVPVTFKNLTITNGKRGVFVNGQNSDVTLGSGSLVTGNGADITTETHCGVYLYSGKLTLDGGKIKNNKGKYGAGVYMNSANAEFTMKSGIIEGNEAQNGGGVYVPSNSTFTMQGGTISGNTATKIDGVQDSGTGNGIYCSSSGFSMSGAANIDSNNDVFLINGRSITIAGELTAEGTVATITPSSYPTSTVRVQVLTTDEQQATLLQQSSSKFAVTNDSQGGRWVIGNDGYLKDGPLGSKSQPNAVGDIVFNDGSAQAYSSDLQLNDRQKAGAVAVIYYVSESTKYGVGLNEANLIWATADSYAVQTSSNENDNLTYYCYSEDDGSFNKSQLQYTDEQNYPAMYWTGSSLSGGYLPAINELSTLLSNKNSVNNSLNKLGKTTLSSGYWSSTVSSATQAYYDSKSNTTTVPNEKKVRYIKKF